MTSVSVIIVEKSGELRELTIKKYNEDDLYKKCNFRKSADFDKRTTWDISVKGTRYVIDLFARNVGKANQENKYDFPPPVDNELYFGNCVLVRRKSSTSDKVVSLTSNEWNVVYEALFGGFEDLNSTMSGDDKEIDELDAIPVEAKTDVGGYLKDGFVVDDDEPLEYDSEANDNDSESNENYYSDSELSEEEYVFSDEC